MAGVPFSDMFDLPTGWKSSGAWRFDARTGYNGGGTWILDGTQRNVDSTLEYGTFVDLSGTLTSRLIYRQKGELPNSDLVTVSVSLDGGETWLPIDTQVGVPPVELPEEDNWDRRMIDLSSFRNHVIRLRFRVQTGTTVADEDTSAAFYQIDNLTIQYLDETEFVLRPLGRERKTLWGLHLIMGTREHEVYDMLEQMRNAGWPVGTIKGTTGTETILARIAEISPETTIVYRSLTQADGRLQDCPNPHGTDPVIEARHWMNGLWPIWREVDADYYEFMNECLPPLDWLVPFTLEVMRLSSERGYCVLVFSFAGASPEPYEYHELLPVYEYALENPCQPGRTHGVALHVAGGGPYKMLSESNQWWGYRYRMYYDYILPYLPEAANIPVFFTEAGPGDGRVLFSCPDLARDIVQYTQRVEPDLYVQGIHLWNVGGPPEIEWVDVTHCLPLIAESLISYYNGR